MVRFAAAALALAATLHGIATYGASPELVLLDFWSPTCGPCMQMKPTVESLVNARYPIRQVDTSQESELARQYGVTGIPCFVMLVDGHEVDRVVGKTSSERLQQMFTTAKEFVRTQRGVRNISPDSTSTPPAAEDQKAWAGGGDTADRLDGVIAPAPNPLAKPPNEPSVPQPVHNKLLSSSVRLTVEDAQGRSHGTGTIIDTRNGEALIITCGHLFRESKGKSPVKVELYEAGPQGVHVVEAVDGEVRYYDLERDVAFVSIHSTRPVTVAPVAPQRTQITKGDLATSVGCSNGQDPTVMATRITHLDRYQGPPNIEAAGAPVEGRSGGGLFNEQGQLVGVCFAADYEGNRGLYAGLESIHEGLKRFDLQDIDAESANGAIAGNLNNGFEPMKNGLIARGQELPDTAPQSSDLASIPPVGGANPGAQDSGVTAPKHLEPIQQAALEEIVSRAATKKVTVIVQSDEPGVENEIIVIENASNEFVEALAARRRKEAAGATREPVVQASRDDARHNR